MQSYHTMKGKFGEYRIISDLTLRGYKVLIPTFDDGIDIVVGKSKCVQIKSYDNGKFMFITAKSKKEQRKSNGQSSYEPSPLNGIDFVILWSILADRKYIIPANEIRGMINVDLDMDSEHWQKYLENWDILGEPDYKEIKGTMLGMAGEYRVISELLSLGYGVSKPIIDNGIDAIIENKNIQVKTAKPHNINNPTNPYRRYIFNFKMSKNMAEYKNNIKVKPHTLENVDYVILWAIGDGFFIIPASEIRGVSSIGFTSDHDKRTKVKWNRWLPYKNNWDVLKGILPEKVGGKEFTCNQCGHHWKAFTDNPTRCPKCHARWRIKRERKIVNDKVIPLTKEERDAINKLECSRVGWQKYREQKKKEGAREITCQQCGKAWYPRIENPTKCPYCGCRWCIKRERKIIDGKVVKLTPEERLQVRKEVGLAMRGKKHKKRCKELVVSG